MDENLHDIDKLFRDPIESHEDMPSAKVWDAIDNNLDKSNVISIKKKYNNLKRIAAALLLLLLGTIVYEIQTKKAAGSGGLAGNTQIKESKQLEVETPTTTGTTSEKNVSAEKTTETGSASNNYNSKNALNTADDKKTTFKNTDKENNDSITNNSSDKSTVVIIPSNKNYAAQSNQKSSVVVNKNNKDKNNKIVDKEAAAINDIVEYKKTAIKKSRNGKTKMIVRASEAESIADEQKKSPISDTKNNDKTNAVLMPLDNTGVQTISLLDRDKLLMQIRNDRNTPDANLNNKVAKNKKASSIKSFHFSLTPFYAPQFSFNRMEDDHHDAGPQPRNGRDQIKSEEQHQSSSTVGILVTLPVGKKWSLQSGVTLLNNETSIEPKKIFAKMDIDGKIKYRFDCASGYTYISPKTGTTPTVGDSVNTTASTNNLKYIGIPLAVNYDFSLGKFNIVPTFGVMANFLVKQRIETEIMQGVAPEKQTISNIQGLKSNYFNAFTGLAVEYNINKRLALSIMPSGNFALSSINKDAAVKSYPNSFGLNGGLKIKF